MLSDSARYFPKESEITNTTRIVPKGPRQIPQGYDD